MGPVDPDGFNPEMLIQSNYFPEEIAKVLFFPRNRTTIIFPSRTSNSTT